MSESMHKVDVGRRLMAAIEALGLSQADVTRALAVSASKLGNWLRGDNYPSEWFVKQFCDRYGVTTDWIYRGIVTGMDSSLADALWKAEQAPSQEPAPAKPRRKSRRTGADPPPFRTGGRVKENQAKAECGKIVPLPQVTA
jgi:transcriptional regulator with XRE-family HTH domain